MSCCCEGKGPRLRIHRSGQQFGAHVSLLPKLADTVAQLPTCRCLQTYLGNKQTYQVRTLSEKDREDTRRYCEEHDKCFYVHCPLIANLASITPGIADKSTKVVCDCLRQVQGLPCSCVLHIGKVGTIEQVSQRINEMSSLGALQRGSFERTPFTLLLEVAAGQGNELGTSWEQLRHLYEGLDKTLVGICIDTQHAFASGMCSFQNHEEVIRLFDHADSVVPRGISLFHLNDSKKAFGSRVDRHENLRQGYIWSQGDAGLKSLVQQSFDRGIDMVLETPSDRINEDLAILSSYADC